MKKPTEIEIKEATENYKPHKTNNYIYSIDEIKQFKQLIGDITNNCRYYLKRNTKKNTVIYKIEKTYHKEGNYCTIERYTYTLPLNKKPSKYCTTKNKSKKTDSKKEAINQITQLLQEL
jgi:hypothetical protein